MDILSKILNSSYTSISYDINNSLNLLKLLSFIPNRIEFGMDDSLITVDEVFTFFNSKSHIRDYNISSILDKSPTYYVVINLSNLENKDFGVKDACAESFRSLFYTMNSTESSIKYNLILVGVVYNKAPRSNFFSINSSRIIYNSDLSLSLVDKLITIHKDSKNSINDPVDIVSDLRRLKIQHIFKQTS